jgi:hypothetical protein
MSLRELRAVSLENALGYLDLLAEHEAGETRTRLRSVAWPA